MHSLQSFPRRAFLRSSFLGSGVLAMNDWSRLALGQPVASLNASVNTRSATGKKGVVATVHPLASQAAIEAFEQGGNAIDAAVAASLMLSVVDIHNSGLGGGGLALIRLAGGQIHALDGRERAPLTASPEMFFRNGSPDPKLSQIGPLASGVPGLVAVLSEAAARFGKISWRSSLGRAAKVAADGFAVDEVLARNLGSHAASFKQFPSTAQVVLDSSGKTIAAGQVFRQPDLARTLNMIAEQGASWFYQGEFAERTDRMMRAAGGIMTARDFAAYEIRNRTPIRSGYRKHEVVGFPPPSSGGIHIAQMLGMLERFELQQIFAQSPTAGLHLLIEVMKRAMADRAHWLGDADFATVPRGLIDAEYLAGRASDIDLSRASKVSGHGTPPQAVENLFGPGKHTTHLTTADDEGNVVALTQTINTSFGSKMIVPGTGVFLNNEMDDFSIAPGVRNAFGLIGSQANAVAPGKRPLSSMSPTIVLNREGKPILSCGAAGGPKIITTTLQVLVRVLDLGQTIEQALSAPRIHHQWSPDITLCESAFPQTSTDALTQLGHTIERQKSLAVAQAVAFTTDGQLHAASDPRVPSSARGL